MLVWGFSMDDDLLEDFISDTSERLASLAADILRLEKNPQDSDAVSRIFRLVHNMKANCGILGLKRLEKLGHHAENVLGRCQGGRMLLTPAAVTLILQSHDRIAAALAALAETGREPPGDDTALLDALDRAAQQLQPPPTTLAFTQAAEEAGAKSLRVGVDTLEYIMAMLGELVLARNQLHEAAPKQLRDPLQRLDHALSRLQDGVMRARMQPVGGLWARLPRLVRDISIDLNRKIRLETGGADTEIDRQVLELVRDPIMHLVRNAAGHGIEPPAARVIAGKPPEGVVRVTAHHEGGQVVVEVADDGRGLDPAVIARAALEKGIVKQEMLDAMRDVDKIRLAFSPGFSTTDEVTALSGRGMGLDVVKTNIERIGGSVEVESQPGKGALFTMRIPLTLAILPALVAAVDGAWYAFPRNMVRQVLRLKKNGPYTIERDGKGRWLRLRDASVPLVSLQEVCGDDARAAKSLKPYVILLGHENARYGVIVDDIRDARDIVVKPLPRALGRNALFSGAALMGAGRVVLIADPTGIARAAGLPTTGIDTAGIGMAGIDMAETGGVA